MRKVINKQYFRFIKCPCQGRLAFFFALLYTAFSPLSTLHADGSPRYIEPYDLTPAARPSHKLDPRTNSQCFAHLAGQWTVNRGGVAISGSDFIDKGVLRNITNEYYPGAFRQIEDAIYYRYMTDSTEDYQKFITNYIQNITRTWKASDVLTENQWRARFSHIRKLELLSARVLFRDAAVEKIETVKTNLQRLHKTSARLERLLCRNSDSGQCKYSITAESANAHYSERHSVHADMILTLAEVQFEKNSDELADIIEMGRQYFYQFSSPNALALYKFIADEDASLDDIPNTRGFFALHIDETEVMFLAIKALMVQYQNDSNLRGLRKLAVKLRHLIHETEAQCVPYNLAIAEYHFAILIVREAEMREALCAPQAEIKDSACVDNIFSSKSLAGDPITSALQKLRIEDTPVRWAAVIRFMAEHVEDIGFGVNKRIIIDEDLNLIASHYLQPSGLGM